MKLADAAKVARSVISRSEKVKHARKFAQHVVPEVVRPARIIWNQAIGAVFLMLAVPAVFKAVQLYRGWDSEPKNGFGIVLSLIFIIVMASFGIASFMKARRIARRP
ncbi:MAG: hypothetical protein JO097_13255 [Acidobacteriaceae bacterium]|nr:hypothetical protein [Acidobacteriaceae bacterium]MBV9297280.1 hypothetical protein [Acidobacteriaceae bacterium]MBV9763460.1 hypothetical protein [Acidobacteriaceae bacterium]